MMKRVLEVGWMHYIVPHVFVYILISLNNNAV